MSESEIIPADPLPEAEADPEDVDHSGQYGHDADGLTALQRKFAAEVVIDWNYSQAAIRAGYSPKSAKFVGSRLMATRKIAEAVGKELDIQVERTRIDAQWVLLKLAAVERQVSGRDDTAARRDRIRVLELIGKHVDVRAFRTQLGLANADGSPIGVEWDLTVLDAEELAQLEYLVAKITHAGRDQTATGGADHESGTGTPED